MKKLSFLSKLILSLVLILFLFTISICAGSVFIPTRDVFSILLTKSGNPTYVDIVMNIRLPRAIVAFFVGGALSLSGYSLQTFFRNPIAGPYILGISSGAKLSVALLFVFAGGAYTKAYSAMIVVAFLGAILSMGFVLLCSRKLHNMALLLVCGVMIGYICTAITDFVVTFANDADIVNLHNWSKGSLSGMGWNDVAEVSSVIIVASLFLFLLSKPMAAYMMGEIYAKSVGVNIKVFRTLLVVISSVLAAVVTAFVGPVSFVGIAVPHIVRGFLKDSAPIKMIPVSFILGGGFCLLCDLIARTVFAPTELSISTVTAIFGAPIVIYMLIQNKIGKR